MDGIPCIRRVAPQLFLLPGETASVSEPPPVDVLRPTAAATDPLALLDGAALTEDQDAYVQAARAANTCGATA